MLASTLIPCGVCSNSGVYGGWAITDCAREIFSTKKNGSRKNSTSHRQGTR